MGSNPTLSVATSGVRHPGRRSRRSGWGRGVLAALFLALSAPATASATQSPLGDPCALGSCPVPRPADPQEPILYLATALVIVGILGLREARKPGSGPDLK